MSSFRRVLIVAVAIALLVPTTFEFQTSAQRQKIAAASETTVDNGSSEMRPIIEYYIADRGSLQRSFFVNNSPARRERFRKFFQDALDRIQKLNFDAMSEAGKVDYILFRNHLEHELRQLDIEEKQQAEISPLIPFGKTIVDLEEARRRMDPIDSAKVAVTLNALKKQVEDTRRQVEAGLRGSDGADAIKPKKTVAFRAVNAINSLRGNLRNWYTFYNGYDPVFTWWVEQPEKELDDAMAAYATLLNERIVGVRSASTGPQSQQGAGQRGGEALDGAAAGDGVVDEQHAPARDVGAADGRLVDLVAAVPGLADEGERHAGRERDRRGQRDAGGLGADDDVDAELAGEARAPGAEVAQQRRVGVRALQGERMDRRPAVIPAGGAGPDEAGGGRQPGGERRIRGPRARDPPHGLDRGRASRIRQRPGQRQKRRGRCVGVE